MRGRLLEGDGIAATLAERAVAVRAITGGGVGKGPELAGDIRHAVVHHLTGGVIGDLETQHVGGGGGGRDLVHRALQIEPQSVPEIIPAFGNGALVEPVAGGIAKLHRAGELGQVDDRIGQDVGDSDGLGDSRAIAKGGGDDGGAPDAVLSSLYIRSLRAQMMLCV